MLEINVKDVKDRILQRNFQNLRDYFTLNTQLEGFDFLELVFTEAEANRRVRHTQGKPPQDVMVTHLSGVGHVTFNFGLFDSENLDISVSGPLRVRFFYGSRGSVPSQDDGSTTSAQTFTGGG